jgi:UDPglucose 6-dehydrogenase
VRAYDPVAMHETGRLYPNHKSLTFADSAEHALEGADALAIVTEWKEFRSPDFEAIRKRLKQSVIFDGRNLYDPGLMKHYGFTYYGIGRGDSVVKPV